MSPENTPILTVDFCLSIGPSCRPSKYLQTQKLSLCSTPLDWMMKYELEHIPPLYRTGFCDFFREASERESEKRTSRYVVDSATGMVSMHNFPCDITVEAHYPAFLKTMRHKYKETCRHIKHSETILLLCNRKDDTASFSSFLHEFHALFPKKYIVINIRHDLAQHGVEKNIHSLPHNASLIEYRFNDTHPAGGDPAQNPNFWLGNTTAWESVLASVRLSDRLQNATVA